MEETDSLFHHHTKQQQVGSLVSRDKLRKLQNQQRVPIPEPKMDTAGLGMKPLENAPEFVRDRERRRKLAQQRQRRAQRDHDEPSTTTHEQDASYATASMETLHDFIGTKSVGGFALRDDVDDTYDDDYNINNKGTLLAPAKDRISLDREAFSTVAYEHHSSSGSDNEEETNKTNRQRQQQKKQAGGLLDTILSSWATGGKSNNDSTKQSKALTSDGRPPPPGFVLGGTDVSFVKIPQTQLPPPEQLTDIQPHVFPPDEHPLVLQTLAHAEQVMAGEQRKQKEIQQATQAQRVVSSGKNEAGEKKSAAFARVGMAMKNRFTTASSSSTTEDAAGTALVPGLSHSVSRAKSDPTSQHNGNVNKATNENVPIVPSSITRTILTFCPEPLLCKRFQVPVLASTKMGFVSAVDQPTSSLRTREETYFQDEILAHAKTASKEESIAQQRAFKEEVLNGHEEEDGNSNDIATVHANRPSWTVYKSIYNNSSGDDKSLSSHDNTGKDETNEAAPEPPDLYVGTQISSPMTANGNGPDTKVLPDKDAQAKKETKATEEDRMVRYKERKHKKRSRRSPSLEDSSDESSYERHRRRRKKEKKHKEKKHRKRKNPRRGKP